MLVRSQTDRIYDRETEYLDVGDQSGFPQAVDPLRRAPVEGYVELVGSMIFWTSPTVSAGPVATLSAHERLSL